MRNQRRRCSHRNDESNCGTAQRRYQTYEGTQLDSDPSKLTAGGNEAGSAATDRQRVILGSIGKQHGDQPVCADY